MATASSVFAYTFCILFVTFYFDKPLKKKVYSFYMKKKYLKLCVRERERMNE